MPTKSSASTQNLIPWTILFTTIIPILTENLRYYETNYHEVNELVLLFSERNNLDWNIQCMCNMESEYINR